MEKKYDKWYNAKKGTNKNRPQMSLERSKKMPNWTNEQKQAIYEKGNNTLVAAAARKWKNSGFSRKND